MFQNVSRITYFKFNISWREKNVQNSRRLTSFRWKNANVTKDLLHYLQYQDEKIPTVKTFENIQKAERENETSSEIKEFWKS